jgi:hypothetical protein
VRKTWTLLTLLACAGPTEGVDPVDETEPPESAPGEDSEPVVPEETEAVEVPEETEAQVETDAPVDSEAPPPAPPTDLGAGFVREVPALWDDPAWQAPASGPGTPTPMVAGDVDGDGTIEVFVGYLRRPSTDLPLASSQAFHHDPVNHTLLHDVALTRLLQEQSPHPITLVADLDGDGRQDLLRNSISHGFYLQEPGGDWFFGEFDIRGGVPTAPGPTAVLPLDVDNDGWLDLLLTRGACGDAWPTALIGWRTGPQTWVLDPASGTDALEPELYGALWIEVGGEPTIVASGRSCQGPTGAEGSLRVDVRGPVPTLRPIDLAAPDAAFRVLSFWGAAATLLTAQPQGLAAIDLDGDQRLELVFQGNTSPWVVLSSRSTLPLPDLGPQLDLPRPLHASGVQQAAGGLAVVDVDADGRPDLISAWGSDLEDRTADATPRATWSDGRGGLVDLTTLLGLDTVVGAWGSIVATDLDGDADPDLLVGGLDQGPALLRNDIETPNRQLSLSLRGTTSNHLGMGAIVDVIAAGGPRQRRLMGESGSRNVAAPTVIFVGLGPAEEAEVEVRWPSGHLQRVEGLAAGAHHVVQEPETVTISEADRRVPADGVSTVTVTVQPRLPDGSARAAIVGLEVAWGEGSWAGPAVQDGAAWSRTLIAPTVAGSAVVEITVDGVVLPLRPRIWWGDAP